MDTNVLNALGRVNPAQPVVNLRQETFGTLLEQAVQGTGFTHVQEELPLELPAPPLPLDVNPLWGLPQPWIDDAFAASAYVVTREAWETPAPPPSHMDLLL